MSEPTLIGSARRALRLLEVSTGNLIAEVTSPESGTLAHVVTEGRVTIQGSMIATITPA